MDSFKAIGVESELIKGLKELGVNAPTEIQQKAIPSLLSGKKDFVGQAETGTGKTVAFGVPLIQLCDPDVKGIQALVLSPTRELGKQIAKQLFKFTKYYSKKVFVESCFGGDHIGIQMERLQRSTQIVVATPGRLLDLVNRKAIDLSTLKTIVLDEADEMLTMGFQSDIEKILSIPVNSTNTWMFSATLPTGAQHIISSYLDPSYDKVQVSGGNKANPLIEHKFVICKIENKVSLVHQFLRDQGTGRGVVFCKTKAGAEKLAKQIASRNVNADSLHGDLSQKERDKVMRAFKNKNLQVLVATDVAARGIDVDGLSFVLHYQLPEQLENYTHRAGRTGRAGKRGMSVAFVLSNEIDQVRELERKLKITFEKIGSRK